MPPPPKKGDVISFDCQNVTVFSKTVKTGGGSAPDNQDAIALIIFLLLLTSVIFYGKI